MPVITTRGRAPFCVISVNSRRRHRRNQQSGFPSWAALNIGGMPASALEAEAMTRLLGRPETARDRWLKRLRRVLGGAPSTPPAAYEMGRFSYGAPTVLRFPDGSPPVKIGAFCSIAPLVEIQPGGMHRTDWVTTYPLRLSLGLPGAGSDGTPSFKGPVTIGNDVWIGRAAKILSGVSVGDGAVIGAYAVVTSDVRPYAVTAGNPSREIRRRFADADVDRLLEIRWWDWPIEEIRDAVEHLCGPDIEAFFEFCRRRAAGTSSAPV
jgi:acetyltransferase-like isoleucine patch superfamily enzyme